MRVNPLGSGHRVTPVSEVPAPSSRLTKRMVIPQKGKPLKGRAQVQRGRDTIEELGVRALTSGRRRG